VQKFRFSETTLEWISEKPVISIRNRSKEMVRQIIDLSVSLQADIKSDPPGFTPQINYVNHRVGATQMAEIFPGLNPKDLPDGEGWAVEFVQMSTHTGIMKYTG
jgi:hypothetical protein